MDDERQHISESLAVKLNEADGSRAFRREAEPYLRAAIAGKDAMTLFVIGDRALQLRQWYLAAQIFTHILVRCPIASESAQPFMQTIRWIARYHGDFKSRLETQGEFIFCCLQRILLGLEASGLREKDQIAWLADAIDTIRPESFEGRHTLQDNMDLPAAGGKSLKETHQRETRVFYAIRDHFRNPAVAKQPPRPYFNITVIIALAVVSIPAAAWLSNRMPNKSSDILFAASPAIVFVAALWCLFSLVETVFAVIEARRTGTLHSVTPRFYMRGNTIVFGEIVWFYRDWFGLIFRFVWLPLVVLTLPLLAKLDALPQSVASAWNYSGPGVPELRSYLGSLDANAPLEKGASLVQTIEHGLLSDRFCVIAAGVFALFTLYKQLTIQRDRSTQGTAFCWWDWSVMKAFWICRLGMVLLDMFLAGILILKLMCLVLVSWDLVASHYVTVSYFSSDGAGGLAFLSDIFTDLTWLVLLLGFFVMASLYFHWDMPEYRTTDIVLVCVYLVLAIFALAPFFIMENQIGTAREAALAGVGYLGAAASPGNLHELASNLKDLSVVRDWKATAIQTGISGPIIPVIAQAAIIVAQTVVKDKGHLPALVTAALGIRRDS